MKPGRIQRAFDVVKRRWRFSALLLIVLALAAFEGGRCGCGNSTQDRPDEILIGAIFALTGATSETGGMYAAGVRDSIRQVTEQGGDRGSSRPVD